MRERERERKREIRVILVLMAAVSTEMFNPRDNKCGEDVEKKEPSCTAGRNVNWYRHYGKQYRGSSKN